MSKQRSGWISRRGQADAETAIDQVIDRQPQAGEQVQQLLDDQIEDSPYQARRPFSAESVEDLAQGMREAGFQGVLIVRPHNETTRSNDDADWYSWYMAIAAVRRGASLALSAVNHVCSPWSCGRSTMNPC